MELKLHNTLTRKKEVFKPLKPDDVRMYVCGPTVYDLAHIGNARPVIVFDVLYRLLRHLYGEDKVTYVRNITDVDDKINARAAEEYPGIPLNEAIAKITSETTKQFHEDIAALGVLEPTHEPRCTEHIKEMIAMIDILESKGFAYEAEGHMLLDTSEVPNYGQLSGRSLDEMIAGARVEVAPYKRNPADSVLWKPSTDEQPGWPSPWGRGRPGWHIECSAMSKAYLGEVFDIHGGGIDLTFPHHENELAQSTCAHDTDIMAQIWMHNGYLQVEGKKMSKSEGNFVTINELLNTTNFGGRKWPGEVLRLAMLMTHYRQPIDWSVKRLNEATSVLQKWLGVAVERGVPEDGEVDNGVIEALKGDLNTSKMRMVIDELADRAFSIGTGIKNRKQDRNNLAASLVWLGFAKNSDFQRAQDEKAGIKTALRDASEKVNALEALNLSRVKLDEHIKARNAAREEKNWAEADRIRDELDAKGIVLIDDADGTTWEIKR